MSTVKAEPKHRGTLVCVVLKAKNLPNKRSIGKQDPYCVLQLGTEQNKTKPDKRGGQHPQWDEQLHFEIYDDMEDQLRKQDAENGDGSGVSLSQATRRKTKAGKSLRVSCYADDNKEPEFIGEGVVDLTDTLRSGEFDEWVTIKAKDRYAGEVYLELTFYSSAAPPKPKKVLKPNVPANTTYGGAGTFSEDFDESEFAPRPPAKATSSHAAIPSSFVQQSRLQNGTGVTASQTFSHMSYNRTGASSTMENVPSSLRPSASIANLDTYTPPYAPQTIQREYSPAPPIAAPLNEQMSSLPPSASAQFYGHRLPDAAPASVVAQRMEDEARRHSQQLSNSSTFHHLPQASSTSTIRPLPRQQNSIDDLIRPLSSMSMQTLPTVSEAGRASTLPGQLPYGQQSQDPSYNQHWYAQQAQQVDQYGRPIQAPLSTAPYSQLPATPTPPVHPHSAPPASHHSDLPQSQSYVSGWNNNQQPSQPPPQHPSTIAPSPSIHADPRRPVSPNPAAAPPLPPPRTHTPSGYQNLPPPPPASAPPTYPAADGHYDPAYGQQVIYQQSQYPHFPPSSSTVAQSSLPPATSYNSSPPKLQSSRPLPQVYHSAGVQSQMAAPHAIVSNQPSQYQPVQTQPPPAFEATSPSPWQHGHAAHPPPARSQSPLPPWPQQAPQQMYVQQPYPGYPPPASPRPMDPAGTPVYGDGAPSAPQAGFDSGHYAVPPSSSAYALTSSAHVAHPSSSSSSHYYLPPSGDQNGSTPAAALYERSYAPNPSAYQPPLPSDPAQHYRQYAADQPTQQSPHGQPVGPGSYAGAVYASPAPPTYPHPPASYYKATNVNQHAPSPY